MRVAMCLVLGACTSTSVPADAPPVDAPQAPDISDVSQVFDAPDVFVPDAPAPDWAPPIPVGSDAYRQWDRLPFVRIGVRAGMRSTYDRSGGNEGADASHFLRATRDDFYVPLDLEGPGVLYFVRTNHWHGSPWHYVVDGTDTTVTETSTRDPDHPVDNSVFEPTAALPNPLTWTWSMTRGADLNWVPIAFEHSLTLGYGRTHYGTGYYIFQRFAEGAENLSRPLQAWDGRSPPDADVLALIRRAGTDIAPTGGDVRALDGSVDVTAGAAVTVADLAQGPAMVRALRFTVSRAQALDFGRTRLRVTWDGRAAPSIDAPVALFFGAGTLYNRDDREFLVKAMLTSVRYTAADVELSAYFPMPYFRGARVELVGDDTALRGVRWHLRTQPFSAPAPWVAYFHATFRDHGVPVPGVDLTFLDTRDIEGDRDWCGTFNGTSFTFSDRAVLTTLEGDPRFFFDDAESPQAQGTGTEEWGGGGDYWGGLTMTLPFAGHPTGVNDARNSRGRDDLVQAAYRQLVADAMPFGRNARIQFEHGGLDDSSEHYRSVTYWYGRPGACLAPTDTLHVGDVDDERAHGYTSPTMSAPESLSTRFELGVDAVAGREVYPATTDIGRHITGTSEFTLRIDPANAGVMLRRKFDYGYPDQRAEVFIADVHEGASFERAGVWYTAGSNQCVASNPAHELDGPAPVIQTSNRRWRDDEFLVPRRLTVGRSAIRVRIVHAPVERPLLPGGPARQRAWSEFRYTAYSYVLPGG